MTALSGYRALPREATAPIDRRVAAALLTIVSAMQLAVALFREVNWDEFHFLGLIFDYQRGVLTHGLQTFHVHLFWWLTELPTDEIGMILVARCLMWLLYLATLYFLFKITTRLVSGTGALLATLLYATLAFVVHHATSFRADPIITALLMGALFGLTRETLSVGKLIVAALAVALAGLISVKSVFLVPVLGMVACMRLVQSGERKQLLCRMAVALAVAGVSFAGLYHLHAAGLGAVSIQPVPHLTAVYDKQFSSNGLFFGATYFWHSLLSDPLQWLLIVGGIGVITWRIARAKQASLLRSFTVLSFASPLLAIAFYRNSYPYFYVFMMAPAAVVAGAAAEAFAGLPRVARILPAALVVLSVAQGLPELRRTHFAQASVVATVHELFPDPVPYIGHTSIIASYPHAAFLMSTWAIEEYRRRGDPVLRRAIEQQGPAFVLVSGPMLAAALEPGSLFLPARHELLPQDAAALRDNYVQHWGPLWVAGKQLPAAIGDEVAFEIMAPGDYTIESDSSVEIDGHPVASGEVIRLVRGHHKHRGAAATLRYGHLLPVPTALPPARFFNGF